MHIYTKIYEFAASAGAFEGYVYGKEKINAEELNNWVDNIVTGYQHLPADVLKEFQTSLDRTLGRAVNSLITALGESHPLVAKLKTVIADASTQSANDFQFKKWFKES
jgi:hypothetical protein